MSKAVSIPNIGGTFLTYGIKTTMTSSATFDLGICVKGGAGSRLDMKVKEVWWMWRVGKGKERLSTMLYILQLLSYSLHANESLAPWSKTYNSCSPVSARRRLTVSPSVSDLDQPPSQLGWPDPTEPASLSFMRHPLPALITNALSCSHMAWWVWLHMEIVESKYAWTLNLIWPKLKRWNPCGGNGNLRHFFILRLRFHADRSRPPYGRCGGR